MKYYFLSVIACCSFVAGYSQEGYTLKVKINNPQHYPVSLSYIANNHFVRDTNYTIENGWQVFKGTMPEPALAYLIMQGNPALLIKTNGSFIPSPMLQFFLTNDEIEITGSANTIYVSTVRGGKANNEWAAIKAKENKLINESWSVLKNAFAEFSPGDDSAIFKKAFKQRSENSAKEEALRAGFIKTNPASLASMFFLSNMINTLTPASLEAAYEKLASTYKNTSFAKKIIDKMSSMDATAVGKQAISIQKKDINGNMLSLEALQGKYVLLDFWGSWCGPCRASHPHLKQLYKKYNGHGFEIMGIAHETDLTMEANRKSWKEAVDKDSSPWLQVLNNEEAGKSDAVKAYGITSFPTKILIDPTGKIIGRYSEEEGPLDEKLKEVFGF